MTTLGRTYMDADEKAIAAREIQEVECEQQYFEHRARYDDAVSRRIFRAGFQRGYSAPREIRLTDDEIESIFNAMPSGVKGFCVEWGYKSFAGEVCRALERKHQGAK